MDQVVDDALEIFTFADLLTAPGSMAAAAFITTAGLVVIAVLPSTWKLPTAIQISVGLSVILYVVAYFILKLEADGILALLISWISCAAAILGIKYSFVILGARLTR